MKADEPAGRLPRATEPPGAAGLRVSLAPASAGGVPGLPPVVVRPGPGSSPDEMGASGPRTLLVDDEMLQLQVRHLDGERLLTRQPEDGNARRVLLLPGRSVRETGAVRREVVVDGWRFEVELEPAARAALRERATRGRADATHSGPTDVRAIIPGVVVSVSVAAGDQVVTGQQLLAIEAMKMQNELRAPRDGTIERVVVGPGSTIDVGDLLLVIG